MSAWVVTNHHIDLLVSAAVERGIAVKFAPVDEAVTATAENAEEIGLLLWGANISSVIYRYRLDGSEEEFGYLEALAEYQFVFYPGVRRSAVQQALECFDYQSCECPDYERSAAAFFVAQLKATLGDPDEAACDREPWGFDSEEAVIAAIQADWDNPAARAQLIELLGPKGYNIALQKHIRTRPSRP